MIAVADSGPLCYLSLINQTSLLPQLFEKVLIPAEVQKELSRPSSPPQVFALAQDCPLWLEVHAVASVPSALSTLGPGEQEAITLASSVHADVFLTDDKKAKYTAHTMSIAASGTIGVLYAAGMDDRVPFTAQDFDHAIRLLLQTNFRYDSSLQLAIKYLSGKLHKYHGTPGR